jgi:hypothetical protein
MIDTNDCKHEFLTVKVEYRRNYIIRMENWLVTSVSLDAEEELLERVTCARCGHEIFVPTAAPRELKVPRLTKAIADFERQLTEKVNSDAFVNELCGGSHDAGDEEEWQR